MTNPQDRLVPVEQALKTVDSWLERWAMHVGNCAGGGQCTCGLSRVRFEVFEALAALASSPTPIPVSGEDRARALEEARVECVRVVENTRFASEVMPGERDWFKRGASMCAGAINMLVCAALTDTPTPEGDTASEARAREVLATVSAVDGVKWDGATNLGIVPRGTIVRAMLAFAAHQPAPPASGEVLSPQDHAGGGK